MLWSECGVWVRTQECGYGHRKKPVRTVHCSLFSVRRQDSRYGIMVAGSDRLLTPTVLRGVSVLVG